MNSAFKERQLSECSSGDTQRRPKRNVSTKSLGGTNGLHWMEEKDLKKALYASLNETKKARFADGNASEDSQEPSTKTASSSSTSNKTDDDSDTKRLRVHAQRKFAQGSNPSSPMPTPIKLFSNAGRDSKESAGPPADFLPRGRRPKTEDFLTFLCLRGTSVLPPSLNYMNIARSCSCSERSSSPDGEAAWNSMDARERDGGHPGSVASSANSVDSRMTAQKGGRHGPKHPVRALASRGDDSRRSSIDSRGAKGSLKSAVRSDPKAVAGRPPKISGAENVPLSKPARPRSAAHAICEKYKQQRLAKSRNETSTTGGRELRSRTIIEATEVVPLRNKSTNVKHHDVVDGHSTCRGVLAPRNLRELGKRNEVKRQPCVQLKRLSPRSLPSVKLRKTASTHAGVRCKGKSVGITPHVRKAKLVPPIVDYDSESERELSPPSSRMSPRVSLRVPSRRSHTAPCTMPARVDTKAMTLKTETGRRVLRSGNDVMKCTRKKVVRETGKKQVASTLVARKLLTTAKSCFGSSKTNMRTSVFRRKTRSLGPVKDLPLVLPLPTKRRFVHVVNKRIELDERKKPKKSSGSTLSRKNVSDMPKSKRLQKSLVSVTYSRVAPSAFHPQPTHEQEKKVERVRISKDDKFMCSMSLRAMRRRPSDATDLKDVESKRQTRRACLDGGNNDGVKQISKQRILESKCLAKQNEKEKSQKMLQLKTGVHNNQLRTDAVLSFSDSDDEPLIKKAKKASHNEPQRATNVSSKPATVDGRRRLLLSPVKQEPMELCQLGPSHKTRLAKSGERRSILGEKLSSDIHRRRRTSVDASIYSRFSEPSPSLSEKIAEAAGDPLDPPTDLDDLTSMSDGVEALDALAGEISEVMSGRLSFGSAQEIQSLMTSEFSGAFDENVTGAMLLASRDGTGASLETGLNFIKREGGPSKADAMTNTSDEDTGFLYGSFGPYNPPSPEEVSVGTQTVTPPPPVKAGPKSVQTTVLNTMPVKEKLCADQQKMKEALKRRLELVEELKKLKLTLSDRKTFPRDDEPASLVAAPTYRPSAEDFKDPILYISKIRQEAEKFGICKIVPPPGFKPECKVMDDMRFTAHNQYIHKVLSRWGPNVLHTECIRRCFKNQGIADDNPPLAPGIKIGGIELDLSHLYHTVQSFGGIQQVMEKKKWHRVADAMHIPRAAQDRVSKVDDAYCKYVLPFDLLSSEEKDRIQTQVIADYERQILRESSCDQQTDDDEEEEFSTECVTKGRSMSLSVFSRVARNTMSMWYKQDPSAEEVEKDYWNIVTEQRRHVVVHAGNIDSSVHGSGFPTNRLIPFSKHPWNLKVFTNHPGNILRCMGPVSGVTIPTLHLSMLFTTGCWYRDPHCLPWIEYLHTGASKIWYSVPAQSSERFHSAMNDIMPEVCKDTVIWLPSDCAMVPPPMLVGSGCPLSRTIQEKGEFVVIFSGAYTSTIACGYSVSESVYFATRDWLLNAAEHFEHIKASCEPPTFSLDKLLLGIATDLKQNLETCQWSLPLLKKMCEREKRYREQLSEMGLKTYERLPPPEAPDKKKPRKRPYLDEDDRECEVCRTICYISMVVNSQDDTPYCLEHAVKELHRKNLKSWSLMYTYDMDEVRSIVQKLENHIESEMENNSRAEASTKKKAIKKK